MRATGYLARFVVFGSFVTDKVEPHDVDVFLVMNDMFDTGTLSNETALVIDHAAAAHISVPAYSGCAVWLLSAASKLQ